MIASRQKHGDGGDPAAPVTPPASSPDPAARPDPAAAAMHIPEALRLLRSRQGLTQKAASQNQGAPNIRTICHWETSRKMPSLRPLIAYLGSLGFDLCDLQDALNEVHEPHPAGCRRGLEQLEDRVAEMERRLRRVEGSTERPPGRATRVAGLPTAAQG